VNRRHLLILACAVAGLLGLHAHGHADEKQPGLQMPDPVRTVLNAHPVACHGEKKQIRNVRIDTLGSLEPGTLRDLIGRLQEQVHFREMPPDGAKKLAHADRELLIKWSGQELRRLGGTDLADKLRLPNYGNAVEHAKLFSGEIKDPAYTPARRWLVGPQIFRKRVFDSLRVAPREYRTRLVPERRRQRTRQHQRHRTGFSPAALNIPTSPTARPKSH
jgi:hypothetical protein